MVSFTPTIMIFGFIILLPSPLGTNPQTPVPLPSFCNTYYVRGEALRPSSPLYCVVVHTFLDGFFSCVA